MFKILSIALVFTSSFGVTASAQDAVPQQRCWLGSLSFSPGATARAGGQTMACMADFTWGSTDQEASGCISGEGKFYGVGAVENTRFGSSQEMQCAPTGIWEKLSDTP
jgi:hypothetical protein